MLGKRACSRIDVEKRGVVMAHCMTDSLSTQAIRQKISRLATGARPRVLDLFAGCGGLSLGFLAAGCEIRAAVESDPDSARSHGTNFHREDPRHARPRDITSVSPSALTAELELGDPARAFDIIVGGPPCQAFARVGRSKLREVADHPEAFRHDPRSRLYIHYLDYVEACAPPSPSCLKMYRICSTTADVI
jgi:DNA (cytosine-5)-methyltransferase 1